MGHFFIATILALLLATGGEAWTGTRGGCSAPSSVAINRIISSTYNDSGLRIVIRENEIVCNSCVYEKVTVLSLYDRCNETSCLPEPVGVVLDILCLDGVWELKHYERVSYSTISNESPNCTDCLDVELFQSRKYPTNPPGLLAYNQTTHCLLLPSCYDEAGSLIGYFSARECCVEKEESRSYRYGDESFPCIVHGFVKTKYGVEEGETLNIVFERNAKGKTRFPLLTIQGSIISEGDEDDYQPVSVTIYRRYSKITFSLTAYNDMIAFEDGDKVILRHISDINNYVNLVEERGEFIRHTTEVAIVDKNNRVEIGFTQSVYTVSEDETGNQILTLAIKNELTVEGPIPLRLTAMSLTSPVVNEAERATPRQDFHVETVDIEIRPGAVGMTNISLNDIIIDDNTVENHIQRFKLMVEVSEDRVFFDSDNSTKKSVEVAIESDDTVSVSLLSSNLVFYESDESPFNICVIVISEGTDQNCPVEFQVNYTLSFTKYSYTENGDGETIFRDVTVDKCNNMTCVDLKTVFSIPNDEEFNTRLFNVSLLPDAETDVPQSGMFRVSTDVVMFAIRDDDLLPSCYDEAGSLIGYFSARECCVEKEESHSYRYGDESIPCIVHGFVKVKYSVVEGETLDIVFGRNAKGTTNFPLLTMEGRIMSEGDEDDYQPVSVTLTRKDSRITLNLTAYNDMIALEDGDKVILRHTSGINNFVNEVEQRGEFISHTTEVTIVDKNNRESCIYLA